MHRLAYYKQTLIDHSYTTTDKRVLRTQIFKIWGIKTGDTMPNEQSFALSQHSAAKSLKMWAAGLCFLTFGLISELELYG